MRPGPRATDRPWLPRGGSQPAIPVRARSAGQREAVPPPRRPPARPPLPAPRGRTRRATKERVRCIDAGGLVLLAWLVVLGACRPSPASVATLPSATPVPAPSPSSALPVGLRDCQLLEPPGRCASIDVGGYNLWIVCRGTGSPTIVLDAGFGDDSQAWDPIIPAVVALSQTCVYDRAGLGASEPPPQAARTSQHSVTDLHTLLTQAAVPGPYVLVGHSFGGLNVRLFADQYREAVSGLVLVDASSPGKQSTSRPCKPSSHRRRRTSVRS